MKRWRMILGIVVLSAGLITGCNYGTEEKVPETYSEVDNLRRQVKEEGIFYINGFTQQMTFYDFKLGESMVLCDKPNCKHDSGECNAYLKYGYQSTMGCYRDKIYFFDITDPEMPFYQADKNGANRKVLTKLVEHEDTLGCFLQPKMIFAEDHVYLIVDYMKTPDEVIVQEDGTIQSTMYEYQILQINLETGQLEVMKKFEDGSEMILHSCVDGSLIFSESGVVYGIDVETKECEKIINEECIDVDPKEKKIYYRVEKEGISSVYAIDIKTKEEELIIQKEVKEDVYIAWDVVGNKLYYCECPLDGTTESGEKGVYFLDEDREEILTQEQYDYRPLQETSAWYITNTEEGMVCIPKEAYENQDWDKVQVIGWT